MSEAFLPEITGGSYFMRTLTASTSDYDQHAVTWYPKIGAMTRVQVEVGMVKIKRAGFITVKFKKAFVDTPAFVKTAIGYHEISIPLIGTIRLPLPIFLTKVDKNGFTVASLGEGWISYVAWELR